MQQRGRVQPPFMAPSGREYDRTLQEVPQPETASGREGAHRGALCWGLRESKPAHLNPFTSGEGEVLEHQSRTEATNIYPLSWETVSVHRDQAACLGAQATHWVYKPTGTKAAAANSRAFIHSLFKSRLELFSFDGSSATKCQQAEILLPTVQKQTVELSAT